MVFQHPRTKSRQIQKNVDDGIALSFLAWYDFFVILKVFYGTVHELEVGVDFIQFLVDN